MLNRRLITLAVTVILIVAVAIAATSRPDLHATGTTTVRRVPGGAVVVVPSPSTTRVATSQLPARAGPPTGREPSSTRAAPPSVSDGPPTSALDGHRPARTVTVEPTTPSVTVAHDQSLATERASRFVVTVNTWRYDTPAADLTGLARERVIHQFHVTGAELDRRASVQEVAWATVTPTGLTALDNTHVTVTLQGAQHVTTNTTTETVRPLAFTVVLADQPSGWVIESVRT